ncbi:MAG: cupin domain-containing protein [Chitinophagaceae bacterium]|jgi:hypothetical protein|nr:cupin domain-containing protein [Chitinophagaceae bacterium]
MPKSYSRYWNVLNDEANGKWTSVKGLEGQVEEITLAEDPVSGHYTRLTRFLPGANTKAFGTKKHDYPEEVYIVSGSLYDFSFNRLLTAGDYASRPPGEEHGPFISEEGCLVLEVSYPSRQTL